MARCSVPGDRKLRTNADYADYRQYRRALWRIWDDSLSAVQFITLMPGDENEVNQPGQALRRCEQFARRWGYGGLWMSSLYSFRARDPKVLRYYLDGTTLADIEVENDENDVYIQDAAERCALTVIAWGDNGYMRGRDEDVIGLLLEHDLYHIGKLSKTGNPRHPLSRSLNEKLIRYTGDHNVTN